MDVVNRIIDTLKDDQNLSWQSLIYEIVKQEGMDPWNIDVSTLSQRFMEIMSQMKSIDFFLSGKVVLTASMLLKYKAEQLSNSDFDIFQEETNHQDDYEGYEDFSAFEEMELLPEEKYLVKKLKLKNPIRTTRKVSLFDLVNTLERAMNVYKRKIERHKTKKVSVKKVDNELKELIQDKYPEMSYLVDQVYTKLQKIPDETIKFSELVGSNDKIETIYTFMPLLQMRNNDMLDMQQEDHFQDFEVIPTKKVIDLQ